MKYKVLLKLQDGPRKVIVDHVVYGFLKKNYPQKIDVLEEIKNESEG